MRFAEERFLERSASDLKTIRIIDKPYCQGCNVPILREANFCDDCKKMRAPFNDKRIRSVIAPTLYLPMDERKMIEEIDDDVDIYKLKNGFYHRDFADLIVDQLNGRGLLFDDSIIIPIPSSNLCSHHSIVDFAETISNIIDGSQVVTILKHKRHVKPQKMCKSVRKGNGTSGIVWV